MNNVPSSRAKILVLHQDPLLSAGVAAALQSSPDFEVLEGCDQVSPSQANVVVADYRCAIAIAEEVGAPSHGPLSSIKVLALTTSDREADICRAIKAGVHGYLLIGGPLSELIGAVQTLLNGGRFMCQSVVARMAQSMACAPLTPRENEVLRLVVAGDSNKSIARELGIELGTVKSHMSTIMSKLGASSRLRAVSIATERGLIEHDAAALKPKVFMRTPMLSATAAAAR